MEVNFFRQWMKEIRRPPNYHRRGLVKIDPIRVGHCERGGVNACPTFGGSA